MNALTKTSRPAGDTPEARSPAWIPGDVLFAADASLDWHHPVALARQRRVIAIAYLIIIYI